VTPIYNSGSFEDPENFRPISVVPVIAKILERIGLSNLIHILKGIIYCMIIKEPIEEGDLQSNYY